MSSFLLLCDVFSFVFWKKLKSTKRHFEINWPLAELSTKNEFFFILLLTNKYYRTSKVKIFFYSFLSLFTSLQNNLVVSISKNRSKFTQSHYKRISKEFKCKFSDDKSFSVFVKNKNINRKCRSTFFLYFHTFIFVTAKHFLWLFHAMKSIMHIAYYSQYICIRTVSS